VYASDSYVAKHADTPWTELDWIFPDGALEAAPATRWLSSVISRDRGVMKIDSFLGMSALARAGVGAALLPCLLGASVPDLKLIAAAPAKASVDVWILTHARLKHAGRISAFVEHFAEGIREQRKQFEVGRVI
jgi:DNA-binding transcriptional LysR family regulator